MNGFSIDRVSAVMIKEFRQVMREPLTYAMILILPIIELLIFGYAINTEPRNLPTAVLVQEDSRLARSVLAALDNSEHFDMTIQARSAEELDSLLRRGEVQFAVTIPGDFTRRLVRGETPQILVEADATDPTATGSAFSALTTLPHYALTHELKGALAYAAKDAGAPFEIVVHRRYNPESVSAYYIVPGLLGVILSMTLIMMTSVSVTREQERGTMESLLATPVQPLEVMAGKLAPYVAVGVFQTLMILVMAAAIFDVPMNGGWIGLWISVALFIIGSLALGFLISTVAESQLQAMEMSIFYILPSILLSGFAFPFRGMPDWAQAIGQTIPVTHFLRAVRGALLKGQSVTDMWRELAALLAFVLIVTALAMARYRRTLD